MSHQEQLTRFCAAFVDELNRAGVKHVVVSPGSRSTPLAILLNSHPSIKVWMNIDERSAAFFALGMSKAGEPAALLCTSGTAAANYYPAITEAKLSRVPLIVLTTDRPHELRDVGAPQAIDQIKLYGDHVKWFQEMPLPSDNEEMLRYARVSARRAVMTAQVQPSGPVHLNFPFREPLIPDLTIERLWDSGLIREGHFLRTPGSYQLDDNQIEALLNIIQSRRKGLIVVGPQADDRLAENIVSLSERLGYPVLADPLSQLRSGSHSKENIIDCYDAFLRDSTIIKRLQPEVVIRFGAMPVAKSFLIYLKTMQPEYYMVVDESPEWREPTHLATDMVYAEPKRLCDALLDKITAFREENSWLCLWRNINQAAKQEVLDFIDKAHWFEGQAVSELLASIKEKDAAVFVGNSMPVRDLDTFLLNQPQKIMTMANRGANGIDGVVSTALGASTAAENLFLIIGDLSLYHDMNGLLAGKLHQLNATIIVMNNNGGGIFSFLPQAKEANDFEQLFGTPTDLDFELVAKLYNMSYQKADSWPAFRKACKDALLTKGLKMIEVQTDRADNTEKHQQLWERMTAAVRNMMNKADQDD
ncbi:2-succinyl-5-enolpyruvyl-6-hydroxy-3-cyclohexene-1-carboxylate synthase [Scopulibacillus daqui]|uniref:2-succinyl-5-enolpyruvyl-6-hydroxy-3-cyclohexene-1-carboxylate synthase n=1 Tax=Scopulibacillus daqui TaxID=1469162 RepID=A0ABS2PWG0_9BACL|nr:2-succinyl-5-enolpyruvyl-6-hydroxy-3-cyclohexene-1-carboxylic-acid synthase [Scopulibacillus daqui]MBM7643905.1 2-succinyl-5-enolpyruvyl-6-hydroxy-3-cyclohexene-1-carboxylate synthase [Scopulibacillus daqui]